jgi:hypothetical protein
VKTSPRFSSRRFSLLGRNQRRCQQDSQPRCIGNHVSGHPCAFEFSCPMCPTRPWRKPWTIRAGKRRKPQSTSNESKLTYSDPIQWMDARKLLMFRGGVPCF